MIPTGVPSPPRNIMVEDLKKKTVVLAWEAPEFDGGCAVSGYHVEKKQAYTSRWAKITKSPISSTMFTIKDLIEDEEYQFRIVAENEAGVSKPSEPTAPFIARDPYSKPGKPGRPEVTLEKNSAHISWLPPTDDGRSPITHYQVEMKSKNDVRWKVLTEGQTVKDTRFVAPGLEPDTDFEFRVTAQNKAGFGPSSPASSPVRYGEQKVNALKYFHVNQ